MSRASTASQQATVFLRILKRIPRHSWVTANDIQQSLSLSGVNISLLTLQRALKTIRETPEFCVECDTRSKPFGYRLNLRGQSSSVELSASEALLLRLVEERLAYQLPPVVTRGLRPLFTASRQLLRESAESHREREWLRKVAVVPNELRFVPPEIKPEILEAVSEALFHDHKLEVGYRNVSDKLKNKVVSPLGLVQQGVRLYLVCQFDSYQDVRHLALHRFETARELDVPAARPEDFSLRRYVLRGAFNYNEGAPRYIRLTLDINQPKMVKNLAETPLNYGQTITRTGDRLWRVEVDIEDSILLDGWLSAWRDKGGIKRVRKKEIEPGNRA